MRKRRLLIPMVAVLLAAAPAMAGNDKPPACTPTQPIAKVEPAALDVPEATVTNGTRSPYDVKLNGNPSSPKDITYLWAQDSTDQYKVTLNNPTDVQPTFSAPDVGPSGTTLHFTLTVKDCSDTNSASTSVTVKVTNIDQNQAPVASAVVLPTETVNEGAVVTLDGNASSDPDGNSLTYEWTQLPGGTRVTINNSATATATFTAPNDAYPNGESLTFRLNVSDGYLSNYTDKVVTVVWVNDPPTASLSCPESVNEGAPVTLDGRASSDTDNEIASYDWSQLSGGPGAGLPTYDPATASTISFTAPLLTSTFNTMKFELKVTDKGTPALFNTTECDVAVLDVTRPVISGADNITKEATSATGAIVTFAPTAHDAVDGDMAVDCIPVTGGTFALGTTSVTCSAADKSGNKAEAKFTVTVQDTTPPAIAAHEDETAEATSAAGAVVNYVNPTATDLVDGTVSVACVPASGNTFALGSTTVNCSATDAHNNAATASFAVSVKDTTPPVISGVPGNITAEATGPTGATLSYTAPTATDLVDGAVAVSCDKTSGSTFALGDTTVTCSASDNAGNAASSSFTITVKDTTPPVIAAHVNEKAEATGPSGAAVSYNTPATSDIVDGTGTASCLPASGSTFALGTTTVTCNASDKAGNNATATTFSVLVEDTTPPSLTLPASIGPIEGNTLGGATVTYTASASDLVDGNVGATCDNASGSVFPVGTTTVNCSATDAHNNKATGSFTVTVKDTTSPTISDVPANVVTFATSALGAVANYTLPKATDLVDGNVAVTCDKASGSVFPVGTTTVTCSASDKAGNKASATFNVEVDYNWNGFLQPVDNLPVVNVVKAGSAVPVKFSLGGNMGLDIFASGYPRVVSIIVSEAGTTESVIDETVNAGGSSLTYDAMSNQYIYVWKTNKLWVGSSYQLQVKLKDNTTHVANFKFK